MSHFPRHSEYKNSGNKWIGDIPSHWHINRYKNLMRERGELSKTGDETLMSVSAYTGVTTRAAILEEGEIHTRADSLVGYKICAPDDLVVNIMLAWNRGLGFSKQHGIVSPAYCVFKKTGSFDSRFLNYLVRDDTSTRYYKSFSTGLMDSRLRLYPETFLALQCALPAIDEQKQIADFLDRETTRIDSLIEKKIRFIELLKEKRQAVITKAVTTGIDREVKLKPSGEAWIGKIPVHWEVKPLRSFFNFRNEKNDPVRTENILSLSIAHGVTPYSEEGRGGNKSKDDLTAYKIAHKGDIVLNSMNVIVGAVGRSNYYGAISPVYYAIYPINEKVYVPYFEKVFMNVCFQKGLLRIGKGILIKISGTFQMNTIRMKISQDDLKNVPFPVPPLEEQIKIAEHIECEVSRIDDLSSKTVRSIELLKEKRAALITAVVTGKINIRTAT